ncbi:hypothetical protein [Micromonospora coerulea]
MPTVSRSGSGAQADVLIWRMSRVWAARDAKRSRGRNTWKNTIGARYACNQRKADLTPAEAGMELRFQPSVPTWSSMMQR